MIDFKQKMEEEEKRTRRLSNDPEEIIIPSKRKKRIITYVIAIIAIGLIFSGKILISSQSGTDWLSGTGFLSKLKHLVPSSDKTLKGEGEDRINILLLGMGGEGHEGAYLTDTIMLASLQPSTKQVSLISIPRDLVAPVSNWQKVNSINAYAEMENAGSGGEVTAKAFTELLQTPIEYYIRVDFNGFANIIDELGGIEVNVENTLDDYSYPILGEEDNPNYYSRYEHLHIEKGLQTMNGSLALKYARSRHAAGGEGSDFSRARRQQLVLEAVKSKLLSNKTLLNPVMVTKLVNEFSKDISTNLNAWEVLRLWEMFKDVDQTQIINKVLSDAPDGLLVSGKGENGAYILTPRSGNFSEVRNMVKNVFGASATDATVTSKAITKISDAAQVIVLNGTWVTGLAGKTSVILGQSGFIVSLTGNSPERDYSKTTVYSLATTTVKEKSLKTLKNLTGATQSFDLPAWIDEYQNASSAPDFLLIVGTDANKAE
jgi:LCP family protein required for cell wall assembly